MLSIKKRLAKDRWNAVSWNYPSRDYFIEEHGEELAHYLRDLAAENPDHPIYFVAHSLGSLVLLSALNHPLCPQEAKVGKVVLLAPPIRGTHFGRWAAQFSIARRLAKAFAGQELMTQVQFDYLGNYPGSLEGVLVIAGNFGFNPILKGENDGTLSVTETVLPTPHQHVVIKEGHKRMLFSKKAHDLILQFFQNSLAQN